MQPPLTAVAETEWSRVPIHFGLSFGIGHMEPGQDFLEPSPNHPIQAQHLLAPVAFPFTRYRGFLALPCAPGLDTPALADPCAAALGCYLQSPSVRFSWRCCWVRTTSHSSPSIQDSRPGASHKGLLVCKPPLPIITHTRWWWHSAVRNKLMRTTCPHAC